MSEFRMRYDIGRPRLSPDRGARIVQLIETDLEVRGAGTSDDPARRVVQLWDFDGKLVAEYDINDKLGCNVTGHRIKPRATKCMHCGAEFKEPAP